MLAIAATLRRPTTPEERCKLQCVDGQRRNNAASCNAPGHRCSVARSCSVASPPAIAAAAVELYTSDVGLSSDFRQTFVRRPSNFRPSNFRPSNFHPTSGPASLLTSSSCVPADVIIIRPAYVIVDVTACVGVLPPYALMSCQLDVLCAACYHPAA